MCNQLTLFLKESIVFADVPQCQPWINNNWKHMAVSGTHTRHTHTSMNVARGRPPRGKQTTWDDSTASADRTPRRRLQCALLPCVRSVCVTPLESHKIVPCNWLCQSFYTGHTASGTLALSFSPSFRSPFLSRFPPISLSFSLGHNIYTRTHSGLQEVGSHAGHVNMPPSDLDPNTRKRERYIWRTLLTHTHSAGWH